MAKISRIRLLGTNYNIDDGKLVYCTQSEYNALLTKDPDKVYVVSAVVNEETVVTIYKGEVLVGDSTTVDTSGKADKVASAINNNFAALDANGNLKDSGNSASDFVSSDLVPLSASSYNKLVVQSTTYTKTEVDNLIGAVSSFSFEIVTTLPASGSTNIIYLLGPTNDFYEEYIYVNNAWVKIGETSMDVTSLVSFTSTQSKTDTEKTRARNNIGFVEITESAYEALVEAGTVDESVIYLTVEDEEE